MKSVLENLRQLGVPRLAALGGVGVAMLLLLGILVFRGASSVDGLLYRDLDPHEAGEIVDELTKAHIEFRLENQGSTILVSEGKIAAARLLLAKKGLPTGGSVGYEIFDRSNGFTATQFEQTINETRALEGELERSIRLINGIKNSRVHLVLRHRELFSTNEQSAQASILLSMEGGRRLDSESVSAIINLVSAAVPGLDTHNISLVDNHGHVLLKEGVGSVGDGESAEEQRQALEQRIVRSVEDILGSSVGLAHVRVEANVTMDNNRVHETEEQYDPNQQVLRSQQTKSEKNINTQGTISTTVTNNLPNANAEHAQNGSQSARQEQTDNYEIGKKVRTIFQDQPRISRLSVAVIVDGISSKDSKGKITWQPRTSQELERLTALTKSAVGFDQSRGDMVTVMSMKFADINEDIPLSETSWLGFRVSQSDTLKAIHLGIFSLCLLLVLFFVVRPLMKPSIPSGSEIPTAVLSQDKSGLIPSIDSLDKPQLANLNSALSLAYEKKKSDSDHDKIQVNGVDGQIKISSMKKVIDLVEQHPSESIAIMRSWMLPDQAVGV